MCFFLYVLNCRRAVLLVLGSFSEKVVLHVVVALVLMGGGELRIFLPCHLDPTSPSLPLNDNLLEIVA